MTRTNDVQHSGGHARWAALSHTRGVEEKSVRNVRGRKVRQKIHCFWHWCATSRSTNLSRSRSCRRKNISVDERKRDAVARLCLDGTDVLNKDRKLQPSENLHVWLRHHVFRLRHLPPADHRKKAREQYVQSRQSQHQWNRVPVAWKQNWRRSWSPP